MQHKYNLKITLILSSILLLVPFVYNSCQGVMGSKGFNSASMSQASCKVMIEDGIVKKLNLTSAKSSVFSTQKVRLRSSSNMANQKASELTLPQGTELAIILNNSCVEQATERSKFVADVLMENVPSQQLITQAFTWNLDRAYSDLELEALADQDPCIVGISWNKEYTLQSLNDPGYYYQTNLPAIQAEPSYNEFFNASYGMKLTGDSVKVAVLDTGIDWTHPDLAGNIWIHQNGWGVDATTLKTTLVNYNPVDVSTIGHGTHVSGIIAAVSKNSIGIVGTMPHRAKIMAIKVFKVDAGSIKTSSAYIYNGLQFAYLNGASVINMSLAAPTTGVSVDTLAEAGIDEALQYGAVVVTVIGNGDATNSAREVDGVNFSSLPGQYASKEGVLGVGSFDTVSGAKSSFSHYSTTFAEISAPGAEQGSTGIYSTLPVAMNSYGRLAGTSQAGPQVSAAAALTIGLIKEAYGVAPTPREVERILLASAVKSPSLAPYFKDGNRLNLQTLVQKIQMDYPKTKTAGTPVSPVVGCP